MSEGNKQAHLSCSAFFGQAFFQSGHIAVSAKCTRTALRRSKHAHLTFLSEGFQSMHGHYGRVMCVDSKSNTLKMTLTTPKKGHKFKPKVCFADISKIRFHWEKIT